MGELTAYIFALQAVVEHAKHFREWIVVVAPTDEEKSSTLSRMLVSVLPPEATLCGRTALFPSGGRVTVVGGSQFLHGDGFRVMFLGFESTSLPADEIAQHAWRKAALGVVSLGDRPGELRVH